MYDKELEKLIHSRVKGKAPISKPFEKAKENTPDLIAASKASLRNQ